MDDEQLEMVKFLIERGADVNAETLQDELTPLNIAKIAFDEPHPIIDLLTKAGAVDNGIYVEVDEDDEEDDDEEEDEESEL